MIVLFQEYTVDQQRTQWFSLYHSLQHYKYHTYLMCKDEVSLLHAEAALEFDPLESFVSIQYLYCINIFFLVCWSHCRLHLFGCMRENWGRWRRSRSVCRTELG